MTTDNSADMTSNVSSAAGNIIKGTIDSAVEQTGSLATNKNVVARVKNTFKFVQERKWMATFRGIPKFVSPTEFCRPPPNQIMLRLQLNTQYFFTNYAAFACLLFFHHLDRSMALLRNAHHWIRLDARCQTAG